MTLKQTKSEQPEQASELDAEPLLKLIEEATQLTRHALAQYGEPLCSLEELRRRIDDRLPDQPLSQWLLAEREARC